MSDSPISQFPPLPAQAPHRGGPPWHAVPAANASGNRLHDPTDPFTEWLLEQRHIGPTDFAVLFAIHKLNGRRKGAGWIRRTELSRGSGLDHVSLTRVLNDLRQRGLVGMSRHPTDCTRARYLLIAA